MIALMPPQSVYIESHLRGGRVFEAVPSSLLAGRSCSQKRAVRYADAGLHSRKIAQDAVHCPGSSLDTTAPLALRPHRRQYVNRTGRCKAQFRCSRQGGQGRRSSCPGSRMRPSPVIGAGSLGTADYTPQKTGKLLAEWQTRGHLDLWDPEYAATGCRAYPVWQA